MCIAESGPPLPLKTRFSITYASSQNEPSVRFDIKKSSTASLPINEIGDAEFFILYDLVFDD